MENKCCSKCGRILNKDYPKNLCLICEEIELFNQVKDYIRSNNVTERQVAAHFDIPLKKVKDWIREGRIEYVASDKHSASTFNLIKCMNCGCAITSGIICPECERKIQMKGFSTNIKNQDKNEKMRFIRH